MSLLYNYIEIKSSNSDPFHAVQMIRYMNFVVAIVVAEGVCRKEIVV